MPLEEAARQLAIGFAPPEPSRLQHFRLTARLTQREVARRLGYAHATISQWERGVSSPRWPQIRALARLYKVPVREIAAAAGRLPPDLRNHSAWTPKDVGRVLEEIRHWRGESLLLVARRAGVSWQTLRRWELGATYPDRRQLRRLERVLGLPPGAFPGAAPAQ